MPRRASDRLVAADGSPERVSLAAEPLLVSLHLPKTAGTSFRSTLQQHYGAALLEDYAMLPMQLPRGLREWRAVRDIGVARRAVSTSIRAIHGHFLPAKYRLALAGRAVRYVTWLRDPVERAVSHYHYWCRDYAGDDPAQPLRNRMLREQWTLERFCLGPEFRDVYHQYLWGFPPRRFAFLGITEHYAEDLAWFARRFLGSAAGTQIHALGNPARPAPGYPLDPALRQRIERHHARDMALYRQALADRRARATTAA
jgi:hypothetical protein